MMYPVLGLLMTLPFILDDVLSLDCPSTYTQKNFILKHHVLLSTTVRNYQECYDKCASNMDCYSMNFYERTKRCELNKGNHLSNPVDLDYNEEGTYSMYDDRSVSTCSDKYCSTDTICVMKVNSNAFECKDCAFAFGMSINSMKIPHSAITASSSYGSAYKPWRGRLYNYAGALKISGADGTSWVAGTKAVGQYLQVNLGHVVYVTMVASQGRANFLQYVTKYSLAYKDSGNSFVDYKIANTVKIFQANTDRSTVVTHRLPEKIKTQYIRFVAQGWHGHISMRAEIYGCQIPV